MNNTDDEFALFALEKAVRNYGHVLSPRPVRAFFKSGRFIILEYQMDKKYFPVTYRYPKLKYEISHILTTPFTPV